MVHEINLMGKDEKDLLLLSDLSLTTSFVFVFCYFQLLPCQCLLIPVQAPAVPPAALLLPTWHHLP